MIIKQQGLAKRWGSSSSSNRITCFKVIVVVIDSQVIVLVIVIYNLNVEVIVIVILIDFK